MVGLLHTPSCSVCVTCATCSGILRQATVRVYGPKLKLRSCTCSAAPPFWPTGAAEAAAIVWSRLRVGPGALPSLVSKTRVSSGDDESFRTSGSPGGCCGRTLVASHDESDALFSAGRFGKNKCQRHATAIKSRRVSGALFLCPKFSEDKYTNRGAPLNTLERPGLLRKLHRTVVRAEAPSPGLDSFVEDI